MVDIMGGHINSDPFLFYREQTIKAWLISRHYFDNLFEMIRLSELSGLVCFREGSMQRFKKRFLLDRDTFAAAKKIDHLIDHSLDNFRTIIYDKIQYIQNKILH